MATKAKENEIQIIREYDAPVALVWEAWTDPTQVAQWWGPRGFTITTHSKDLRPGGSWVYTMHGPDGVNYPNKTVYHEVVEHKKLVYDHGANDERPALFQVSVQFFSLGERTRMEMTMRLDTAEAAKATKIFIKNAGGNATWDRLAEYLAKTSLNQELFVINRSFQAPRELVFSMWTNPQHLANWLAPKGFSMKFIKADIKPGGSSLYQMSNNTGIEFYGRAFYQEILSPSRLVYTQEFCDSSGTELKRHPLAPVWPGSMRTIVCFFEENQNETRICITWEPTNECTSAELLAFVNARAGMTQGWTGSLDKLEEALEKRA